MKAKHRQSSSDPLPYVQVDRAVKTKAGQLAGMLKVSRCHVLGALVEFWELCGDPRELERLVEEGRREVVLTDEEIRLRFKIASDGLDVDPAALVALGLLERRPSGFRVRGMARYFLPIERRLSARRIAVAGGAARANAPRQTNGQFISDAGAPAGNELATRLDLAQPHASRTPADDQPTAQPTDEPKTSRQASTADSEQRTASTLVLELPVALERDGARLVFEHWQKVMGKDRAAFDPKRRRAVEARLRDFTVDDLRKAIDGCSRTPHNMGQNDKGERYNDLELICRDAGHVERFMTNADHPPVARRPGAPVPAESVDWSNATPGEVTF